jgi:hypothetical protein
VIWHENIKKNREKIETNVLVWHPRLFSIAIYAGVAIAISAAIGFALYPEQQMAFALRSKDGWEEG